MDNCGNIKCNRKVVNGICCDICDTWWHNKCSGLSSAAIKVYVNHDFLTWVCLQCLNQIKIKKQDLSISYCDSLPEKVTVNNNPKESQTEAPDTVNVQTIEHLLEDNRVSLNQDDIEISDRTEAISTENANSSISVMQKSWDATNAHWKEIVREIVTEEIRKAMDCQERWHNRLDSLERQTEYALGRQRNVIICGIPEPFIKVKRFRTKYVMHCVMDIMRMARIKPGWTIKRAFRIGKW
ncbi:MAG: PHD finger domain-containing protein, partial [Lactococcus garvieae]